jgi:hypothetical protein
VTVYACLYCGSKLESPSVAHAQQAKRQVAHNVAVWIVAESRWWANRARRYGFSEGHLFPWEHDEVDTVEFEQVDP